MTDIAELGFEVDSSGLVKAEVELDKLDATGQRVTTGFGTLGKAATGLAAIVGTIGFAQAVGDVSSYVDALAEVSTLVDTATFDMAALSRSVIDQAGQFGSMPVDTTKAFYQAISAGAGTAEEAIELLNTAQKLSVGGVTDITTAVDGLTTIMNAYNGQAGSFKDISDALFVAMKAGKTTVGELSTAIGGVASIASQTGVSIEEVLAATSALTASGNTTSVSMNGLRAILATVIGPTEEAKKVAADLGLEFNAAALESKGLAGFLADVADKTGGSSEKMKQLFANVEAFNPAMALTTTASEKFAVTLGDMADKAGETEAAVTKMANSPGFQMDRILGALAGGFTDLTQTIVEGSVPAMTSLADGIETVFGIVNSHLKPAIPYLDEAALGIAAFAVGAAAFAALTSPITLAAVAVGSLAVGGKLLYENWDGIGVWWSDMLGGMAQAVDDFAGAGTWDQLTYEAEVAWDAIGTTFDIGINLVAGVLASGMQVLQGDFSGAWDTMVYTVQDFGASVADALTGFASTMYESGVAMFQGLNNAMFEAGLDLRDYALDLGGRIIQAIIDGIKTSLSGLTAAAGEIVTSLKDGITGKVSGIVDAGIDTGRGFVEGLLAWRPFVKDASQDLAGTVEPAMNETLERQSPSRVTFRVGTDVAQGLADGLMAGMDSVGYAARQMADHLTSYYTGFYDSVVQSLGDANSLRDVFSDMGGFMEKWLREYIGHFAANKITVFLGMDGSSMESGFGALMGKIGTGFSGIVQTITTGIGSLFGASTTASDSFGVLATDMNAAAGATGLLNSGLVASEGAAQGAGESFGVLASDANAASTSMLTTATQIVAMGKVSYDLGVAFGGLVNAADETKAGIGAAVAGIPGAIIGAAMGGSWEKIQEGFELAFQDGDLVGKSYEYFEKEKSLWRGTASSMIYDELNYAMATSIMTFFDELETDVVSQLQAIGVSGSQAIFDSFDLEPFRGESAAELQEWLETVTREAYKDAFQTLSPELQAFVLEHVDRVNTPIDQLETIFGDLATAVTQVLPGLENMGITVGTSFDAQVIASTELVQALGGSTAAMQQLTLFNAEFVPVAERTDFALLAARQSLDTFNESLNTGNGTVTVSTASLQAYWERVGAAGVQLDDLSARFDVATGQWELSEAALSRYLGELATSPEYTNAAYYALVDLADSAQQAEIAAINTRDGLYEYVTSLDLTTQAGQDAFAAAMQLAPAIIAVEDAAIAQAESMRTLYDVTRDLGIQFSETSPSAIAAMEAIQGFDGGLKAFVDSAQNYMQAVYSEAEITNLELAKNAAAVQAFNEELGRQGAATIDTTAELRTYVESLGPLSAANADAYASAFALTDAIVALEASGYTTQQAIDQLPPHLQAAFDLMIGGAQGTEQTMARAADTMLVAADTIARAFGGVGVDAETMAASAANASQYMQTEVSNNFGTMSTSVTSTSRGMLDGVVANAAGMSAGVVSATKGMAAEAAAAAAGMSGSVVGISKGMAAEVTSAASGMSQSVAGVARGMSAETSGIVAGMATSVSQKMQTVSQAAANGFNNVAGSAWNYQGQMASVSKNLASGANGVSGAASSAQGNLNSFANSISSAGRAASSTVGQIYNFSDKLGRVVSRGLSAINGSHATGLDYVPFDGYVAELHKGEMVLPASVSEQIRNLGPANANVGEGPAARPIAANDGSVNELRAIRAALERTQAEIEALRREQGEAAADSVAVLDSIDRAAKANAATSQKIERQNDQLARKLA